MKPIYGEKIDRLWKMWHGEDAEGRQEIERIIHQLYMESLRKRVDDEGIFLDPPPADKVQGEYPVGCVLYHHALRDVFGLREDEWLQHVAVLGRSGSGKTNLVYLLIANLLQKRKPFLIFDWKRNYRPIISRNTDFPVQIYTVGNALIPFHFNPLIPPSGVEPTAWLKKLIEILAKATFVGEGVMHLLQQGLDALYKQSGVYAGTVERYPTLHDLHGVINEMRVSGRAANWMASTQRALAALSFGAMGDVLNTQSNAGLAELLNSPVVLELDALTASDKVFFIESLLLWIHHYRLSRNERREQFRHAIIIEEAHHILKKQPTGSSESVTDLLLREIRELGESMVLVDQHPSQISLPALGNTYTTFTMNLKSREDVNAASSYLMFEEEKKKYLNQLEIGQAIVKLQGRWSKPFLIAAPYVHQKQRVISDPELQEYMKPYSSDFARNSPDHADSCVIPEESAPEREEEESPFSEIERAFVQDVRDHPLSGVVQRYKRLGVSRRKGNQIKENLQNSNIIVPVDIVTRKGKVVLLDIHPKEKQPSSVRNPGVVHEFWRAKVAEHYEKEGYAVTREHPLEQGDYVDLHLQKGEEVVAVEIETGKSDVVKNAKKNIEAGYPQIQILGTDIEATHHLHTKLSEIQSEHPQRIFIGNCADVVTD